MYPINLDERQQHYLTLQYPYAWARDGWKYPGVFIPTNFSTFLKRNLESTHTEVRNLLMTWNNKTFTWFERITVIKMMVFPKYLFLFWTAPLHVTPALLHSWQRDLTDFVWSYKNRDFHLTL